MGLSAAKLKQGMPRTLIGFLDHSSKLQNHVRRVACGTSLLPRRLGRERSKETDMGKGILMWLIGIPIPIIILILLFWH